MRNEGGGESKTNIILFQSWYLGGICCHKKKKKIVQEDQAEHIYFGCKTGLIGNEILYRNVRFRSILNTPLPKLILGGEFTVGISLNIYVGAAR